MTTLSFVNATLTVKMGTSKNVRIMPKRSPCDDAGSQPKRPRDALPSWARRKQRSGDEREEEARRLRERRRREEEDEREQERAREAAAREKDEESFRDWREKEQLFLEVVTACRTEKRIREAREKPVDFLAKAFRLTRGDTFTSLTLLERPLPELLKTMTPEETRELYEELCQHYSLSERELRGDGERFAAMARLESSESSAIEIYHNLEWKKDRKNLEEQVRYWSALEALVRPFVGPQESDGSIAVALPPRVEKEIELFLQRASEDELEEISREVEERLRDPQSDQAYWEAVADNLPRLKAERVVNKIHAEARRLLKLYLEERQKAMQEEQVRAMKERRAQADQEVDLKGAVLEDIHPRSPQGLTLPLYNPYNWSGALSPRLMPISSLALPSPKLLIDEEDLPWTCSLLKRNLAAGLTERDPPAPLVPSKKVDLPAAAVAAECDEMTSAPAKAVDEPGLHSPRLVSLREVNMQLMGQLLTETEAADRRQADIEAAKVIGREKAEKKRAALRREEELDKLNRKIIRDGAKAGIEWDVEVSDVNNALFDKFVKQERARMSADEEVMEAAEVFSMVGPHVDYFLIFSQQHYNWEDQYRPRRPRYFNRVRTGFEWNRYNQTHYDRDNPPPKVVQGYKFTLFFPELVDPTNTPQWVLEPSDEPDTVNIRFIGGPPYEDAVFKILNREWEINARHGFKNSFDKGVLQLHFNLKRYKYRR